MDSRWRALSIILFGIGFPPLTEAAETTADGLKAADLFQIDKVWTVHLMFTPDQWEAMEPEGGGGPFGGPGGPGGPRIVRGPGRPDGPDIVVGPGRPGGPGGPGGFGPGMFLTPVFLQQGDQNQDGKLSKEEFQSLGAKWFGEWDKDKRDVLNADQVRDGLNVTFAPPGFGPPGPGAPKGGPPGMVLQGPEGKRNGLASAIGLEFDYVRADLEFGGKLFQKVGVRYKGNGTFLQSRVSEKRSLKVEINRYVKGQKLAGVATLNLHNCVTDASWMNEVLSHRLFRDAGVPAPRTAYARVYVTVPGKFDKKCFGLYSLVENIDKDFTEDRFGLKKGGILKPVTQSLFADLGSDWSKYKQTYDPKTDLTSEEIRRLIEFCRLVDKADDTEFAAKLGEYLDLDEFARFMAVTVWLSTLDSILVQGQNYYVYLHPKTRKLQFFPWDLDHSFGQFFLIGTQDEREKLHIRHPWRGDHRFLARVFKVEAFKRLYLAKFDEFAKTVFKPERFERQVDDLATAIRPAVREESAGKLARFDKVAAGESIEPAGFGPEPDGPPPVGNQNRGGPRFGGPGGFMQPVKPIKAFVKARAQSVLDQLAGKSEGMELGGFPFGGPGPRPGPDGPGGPGGFGPGMFLGPAFMTVLDANKDGKLDRDECRLGFVKWFETWNVDKSGMLTEAQLREGINRDLTPFRGGPPGGPGFGPPGGGPPPSPR